MSVDGEHPLPHVGGGPGERCALGRARVGDDDVDRPGLGEHPDHVGFVGDVGRRSAVMRGSVAATASSGSRRRPTTTTSAPAAANPRARSAPDTGAAARDQHPTRVERHARIASCARCGQAQRLVAALQIGKRPLHVGVAQRQRGPQRPVRIGEVRAGEADQVGPARHQDRVGVVGFVDVAHRHRGDARLVADPVGERRLEHPPVHGLGVDRRLSRRHVDDVGTRPREHPGDLHRLVRRDAVDRRSSRWPRS